MGSFIELPDAPSIPGLRFRHFDPAADYPAMCAMLNLIERESDSDEFWTPQLSQNWDASAAGFDPARDRLIAEVNGQMIGAGRVQAETNLIGERVYMHSFTMLPQWRRKGIGRTVLRYNERRLREMAAADQADAAPRFFDTWAIADSNVAGPLMESEGYSPFRFFHRMIRPHLDDIPDAPLPSGIEARPIEDGHLRAIWESNREAFRDHWGYIKTREPEKAFKGFCEDPHLRRDLSRIAWDGAQVVGNVMIFIIDGGVRPNGAKRAWTESISVRKPWRKRGIARALIARCLHAIKQAGMTEAALGVDTNNISGALLLYESLGYQAVKRNTVYRKVFVA